MINLDNHNNHSHCTHYIYLTLGINERQGFLYIGQHTCKVIGEFDNNYFGSGLYIKRIEKKYGMEYIRNNFKCIPIWWCENQNEANRMETYFITEYEAKDIGSNIANGGEGCVVIKQLSKKQIKCLNDNIDNFYYKLYDYFEDEGYIDITSLLHYYNLIEGSNKNIAGFERSKSNKEFARETLLDYGYECTENENPFKNEFIRKVKNGRIMYNQLITMEFMNWLNCRFEILFIANSQFYENIFQKG